VAIGDALRVLRRRGIWSLMVEGGSELLGSFLAARAFDELALFRAPLLLGGRGSLSAFGGPDPSTLDSALRMEPVETAQLPGHAAGLVEMWRPRPGSVRRPRAT
jgi:diaminohydroxyphosphoribosylaminopyrimidine deaminase/5-amino-6-(5-phosphoribosylamino)uracil reductase